MSSKNFYGLTGDVTVDGGILNVGNAQLYANTETSNVGIGTPNPEFELDVRGDANVHNLYATYLHGDGSNIENIVSSQWEGSPGDPIYYASNVGIANTSPVTTTMQIGSNVVIDDVGSNVMHVTGNVHATRFIGDGAFLENIASNLHEITTNGNVTTNTVQFDGSTSLVTTGSVGIANTAPVHNLDIGSNLYVEDAGSNVLYVTGNIYADYLVGDGSQLTGIAASLDQIVDQGNTVSNTIQIVSGQDATSNIGLVTHDDVGISVSNTNPTGAFQFGVGSNLLVNVYSSNVLTVDGNVLAQKMTLGTVTVTPAYNLQQIMNTGATTNQTLVLENATTGLTTTSNVGIANTAPVHTLDVGSNLYVEDTGSNVLTVTGNVSVSGDLNVGSNLSVEDTGSNVLSVTGNVSVSNRLDVGSNLHIENLRVAEVASNLVTYDSTTGEIMDSGGLFSNKLAVVSEQPPIALTGASTLVTNHGTYTIEASSGTVVNLFDKVSGETNKWVTDGNYSTDEGTEGDYNGSANLTGEDDPTGEWAKITMPYKTILRHVKIESTNESVEDIRIVGLNSDGLTWSVLKTVTGLTGTTHTIIVNATTHHKTYGLIVEKTNTTTGRSAVEIGDLKLFTESFSIDGGKVEMATSAVMGGETTMDQHGPHSRDPKAVPLKKYPEIVFDASKMDGNDSTNTYIQAGYTVTASSQTTSTGEVWRLFDDQVADGTISKGWRATYGYDSNTGLPSAAPTRFIGHQGHWVEISLPQKIQLHRFNISPGNDGDSTNLGKARFPKTISLHGYDGSSWSFLQEFTTSEVASLSEIQTFNITTPSGYYNSFVLTVKETYSPNPQASSITSFDEWKLYGYEEDPPAGDTSVDTTFTSIMNTPQTTGANVYVDGSLGETFTNRVTGPDATGPSATYDETGKYWELNGTLTSNIAVEANTFLEGDAPHSVSVWFNSSNLEANVSNTCVFSVSDQEKLDSVNLDLQSNTWHNLTYAYQGEGGSRVTYLDGRKVAEDQAEDTFGDYPPFAMTGYSQGGYVVSASNEYDEGVGNLQLLSWMAFDNTAGTRWDTANDGNYNSSGIHNGSVTTEVDGTPESGEWIQLEFPHKLRPSHFTLNTNIGTGGSYNYQERAPKTVLLVGSNTNNGTDWVSLFNNTSTPRGSTPSITLVEPFTVSSTNCYKYFRLIVLTTFGGTSGSSASITELQFYGHRENDLVRLPDPTNVLKYPHIAMTGPAQRGYVASASSTAQAPYLGFTPATSASAWVSGNTTDYDGANNDYNATTYRLGALVGGGNTEYGEWLKLELPHKLAVNKMILTADPGGTYGINEAPDAWKIYGSNDDTNWVELLSVTGATPTTSGDTRTISNSTAYKYLAIVITSVHNITAKTRVGGLEYYGTGVDSVPIQIGGGNIDKVANFRVYDKFIGEDQALEIWDAQKDEFRGVKNSVTLQKGRLGIGTTEPEGRLAVADEPHNLEEFPPRAMTAEETYMEGHGVFKATADSHGAGNTSIRHPWKAFIKGTAGSTSNGDNTWLDNSGDFNSTTGVYDGSLTHHSGSVSGEYLQLELPYEIQLSSYSLAPWNYPTGTTFQYSDFPRDFIIYGSKDSISWDIVDTRSSQSSTSQADVPKYHVNSQKTYKYFVIVVTKINTATYANSAVYVAIGEWRLFGTREQGQSVLHDGQLTLTKSLNVPRIGPALDADDTPRRDRLVVEYNTSTNPTSEGAVRDTSGRGNDGVFYGGASYDANEKSLSSSGTTGEIRLGSLPTTTITQLSFSFWINPTGNSPLLYHGYEATSRRISFSVDQSGAGLFFAISSNYLQSTACLTLGQWQHVSVVFLGGSIGSSLSDGSAVYKLYIDGVDKGWTGGLFNAGTLQLENGHPFVLMNGLDGTSGTGAIKLSNFKYYDCALTAEEVKTLYDMGRCDEGHHVVNFSKTRVGIGLGDGEAPHRDLDVRGRMRVGTGLHNIQPNPTGSTGTGANVPTLEVSDSGGSRANPVPTVLQITNALGGGSDWSLTDPFAKLAFATVDASGPGDGGVVGSIGMTCTAGGGGDDSRLIFATDSGVNHSEKMCITKTGNVGIGTTSPNADLYLKCSADTFTGGGGMTIQTGTGNKYWRMIASDYLTLGRLAFGYSTNNTSWSDSGYLVPASNNQMNFTGQHRTFIKDVPFSQVGDLEGLIVSSDQNKYIKMSGGIEAGSNAITTNESLPVVSLSTTINDKKCFGVISASEDPENREEMYGNFGSVFEKEKGDTRVYINSVGEGAIWVSNIGGSLEAGDYITTSNVAGYGQKQDDDVLHNYTVAKITMDCDFEPATQPVQQILRSNVVETYYLGNVHKVKNVPHEFVTTVVGADDAWSNVSVSPSDVTYAEWSNLEANTQNTYTLTYTQTSNVVYDTKYTLTTTANVTESDAWDRVFVDPPTVTYAEYSNLEANTQNTYTLTYTQTTTDEKTPDEWSNLESNVQSLYNKVYYQSVEEEVAKDYPGAVAHTRVTDVIENELDEHGQIQWEDHPTDTEKAYKIRYLDASGVQTDSANAVHIAAFVGCTYHCG